MSLRGVLADFGVADIFQLIAQQRKTGILSVERESRKLEIRFREGSVLRSTPEESRPDAALAALLIRAGVISEKDLAVAWAEQEETLASLPRVLVSSELTTRQVIDEARKLLNEETIFELFLWDDGRFSFLPCEVEQTDADRPVGAEMVLLDALRMRDEWAVVAAELEDLSAIVKANVDLEGFRSRRAVIEQSTGISGIDLERVFNLIDGRIAARRVIDLARLGTFDGGRALVAMIKEGLVEKVEVHRPGAAEAAAASRWQAPILPLTLLVLSAAAAALFLLTPAPAPAPDYPLPTRGLVEIRQATSMDQVRALLETHRWAHGGYPESLREVVSGPDTALAPLSADLYSYARAADGGYTLQPRLP